MITNGHVFATAKTRNLWLRVGFLPYPQRGRIIHTYFLVISHLNLNQGKSLGSPMAGRVAPHDLAFGLKSRFIADPFQPG
jgi:hypothetical protein